MGWRPPAVTAGGAAPPQVGQQVALLLCSFAHIYGFADSSPAAAAGGGGAEH